MVLTFRAYNRKFYWHFSKLWASAIIMIQPQKSISRSIMHIYILSGYIKRVRWSKTPGPLPLYARVSFYFMLQGFLLWHNFLLIKEIIALREIRRARSEYYQRHDLHFWNFLFVRSLMTTWQALYFFMNIWFHKKLNWLNVPEGEGT